MPNAISTELELAIAEVQEAFALARETKEIPEQALQLLEARFTDPHSKSIVEEHCARVRMWVASLKGLRAEDLLAEDPHGHLRSQHVSDESAGHRRSVFLRVWDVITRRTFRSETLTLSDNGTPAHR